MSHTAHLSPALFQLGLPVPYSTIDGGIDPRIRTPESLRLELCPQLLAAGRLLGGGDAFLGDDEGLSGLDP
jgi:hypothetical protein